MSDLFVMKTHGAEALKKWLSGRRYNTWSHGGVDNRGQPLIGLGWDWKPDSDWSKPEKRGLIVCVSDEAKETALAILRSKS